MTIRTRRTADPIAPTAFPSTPAPRPLADEAAVARARDRLAELRDELAGKQAMLDQVNSQWQDTVARQMLGGDLTAIPATIKHLAGERAVLIAEVSTQREIIAAVAGAITEFERTEVDREVDELLAGVRALAVEAWGINARMIELDAIRREMWEIAGRKTELHQEFKVLRRRLGRLARGERAQRGPAADLGRGADLRAGRKRGSARKVAQRVSWETRRNGRYYYAARKVGGRVVKSYCGAGPFAELAAGKAAEAAAARRRLRETVRAELAPLDAVAGELRDLKAAADVALAAALVDGGYHRHKRQWRKRRG